MVTKESYSSPSMSTSTDFPPPGTRQFQLPAPLAMIEAFNESPGHDLEWKEIRLNGPRRRTQELQSQNHDLHMAEGDLFLLGLRII